MKTTISIEGTQFLINGQPTYQGRVHEGRRIEGLLFNTRMANAIFDDANPATAVQWVYPDTGVWDPDRNTDEFCAALPTYAAHGVLAVTVGLQGGGSVYEPDIYDHYINSAFTAEGDLKPAYGDRLLRILQAADALGMIVIVNYFYNKLLHLLDGDAAIRRATTATTDWLLATGHTNVLVDVMNEFRQGEGLLESARIHEMIALAQSRTRDGRRLLVGSSVHPENWQPGGAWSSMVDFYLPHGNDQTPDQLREEIRKLRATDHYQANPRPLLINEDSIHLASLEVAVDEYVSWGYFSQGYGSGGWEHGRFNWLAHGRESTYEELSGFQTVPINWSLNTDEKRAFFERVRQITGGAI